MLRYSDELRYGSPDEVFFFKPAVDGAEPAQAPQNMLVKIAATSGATVLESAECTWNADAGRIELPLDLSGPSPALLCASYRAEVGFDIAGRRLVFDCAFDVVPRPWQPNVGTVELLALAPALACADDGYTLAAIVGEAEEQLRLRIRAAGLIPGLVANRAALDQCLRSLILSLACQRASRNAGKDGLWNKHLSWQAAYESKWRELSASLHYDGDRDGSPNAIGRDVAAVRLKP